MRIKFQNVMRVAFVVTLILFFTLTSDASLLANILLGGLCLVFAYASGIRFDDNI
jgi:hypothetical protein